MKFILAKKLEMTQVWKNDKVIAVTQVLAGPCVVSQVKNNEKDGYQAAQIGFGDRKEKNINKPQRGHFKGLNNFKNIREFRLEDVASLKRGDIIKVDTFVQGDIVDVVGVSKGRGFQGVVKRHGFGGSKKTHGNKDQLRMPGSVGSTGPAHVFKGTRMAGRMGGDRVTVKNLEIVEVDTENNILLIKGAVPGAINGLLLIQGEGELKLTSIDNKEEKKQDKKEEKVEETKIEEKVEEKKEEVKEETKKEEEK